MNKQVVKTTITSLAVVILSCVVVLGYNWFLIPHTMLSGGVSGVAMLLNYITKFDTVVYYVALNIPIMIAGAIIVGRRFILYSVISVVSITVGLRYIPIVLVTDEPMLSAVYGGVLVGVGSGLILRLGGSTGGFDVLGALISKYFNLSVGTATTYLNGLVMGSFGLYLGQWELALFSALGVYVTGRVVNFIHTAHEKVSIQIMTFKTEEMIQGLYTLNKRGVTKVHTQGGYSGSEMYTILTVVTRYEMSEVKSLVKSVDKNAFVIVSEVIDVWGKFQKSK